ncbi:sensor histidine kinase [Paenalkalicoccus suaedae]|uniref:Sensor histidine kinase n=1 Tax=Paenalkalicoccus suaedae TaxID=2592382 RepID=A0A859FHA5_9BACI|nr:sensor histidine kinase [Paenalkalicoccus suaedae]QKS72517.1 sensor histidine kinase [Paenalkalicoccus suaedae]
MKTMKQKLREQSLFWKLFVLTVVIVVSVTLATTYQTIRMAESLFIDTFSITNEKVLNQITGTLDSYNYSVIRTSNQLQNSVNMRNMLSQAQSNSDMMNVYYDLYNRLEAVKTTLDPYEVTLRVTGVNGVTLSTGRPLWEDTEQSLQLQGMIENRREEPRRMHYDYIESENEPREQLIVASTQIMDRITGVIYGAVYLTIREEDFREFYSRFTSPGNDVFMLDQSGIIVSSNRTELIGTQSIELLQHVRGMNGADYVNAEFLGEEHIIVQEEIPAFDMHIVNTIDRSVVTEGVIDRSRIIFTSGAIALVAILIIYIFSRRWTGALSRLVTQIGDTSKYEFDQKVSVVGTYETKQIGLAFNHMLDELHAYVDQLVTTQKQKRNAELESLQQQINPHFLYNTLTSVKFMISQGSKEEAAATITSLISLLQNTIANVNEMNTVNQEIDNLKHYVFINHRRYGERVTVNYFIADDCKEIPVPKLFLQPFVENAFFHGFNEKKSGTINVMVWKEANKLFAEVMDNGDGMVLQKDSAFPEKRQKRQQFSGVGIRNVHERIQLIYGDSFGVQLTSEPQEGTRVRIELGVLEGQDQQQSPPAP